MNKEQVIELSKLLVAIAWTDEKLHPKEVELIQGLMAECQEITFEDQLAVRLYYEYPLSSYEVQFLLKSIKKLFVAKNDARELLNWVKKLIYADAVLDEREKVLYASLLEEMQGSEKARKSGFSYLFQKGQTRTPFMTQEVLGRERHLDDYLYNPVYFQIYRNLQVGESKTTIDMDKETLRRICLGAMLMMHVVHADKKVQKEEVELSIQAMIDFYEVSRDVAEYVIQCSMSFEPDRFFVGETCIRFKKCTKLPERKEFVKMLNDIALSDESLCEDTFTSVMRMGYTLELSDSAVKKILGSNFQDRRVLAFA